MARLLKIVSNEKYELSTEEDILAIHLGYFLMHGKVSYSTDIKIAEKPKYVLLTLQNITDFCYLCEIEDYSYNNHEDLKKFIEYSPDVFKEENKKTWLLFSDMVKIPIDLLDKAYSEQDDTIKQFIKARANNKKL